jgi:hypothetical protein
MTVENMIENSLKELSSVYDETGQCTRLIFPKYSNETGRRISEQEARFLFVREVEKSMDFYYAIEAPTDEKYHFSKAGKKIIPQTGTGRSGQTDVCIYDKDRKKYTCIEFKFGTAEEHEISKDFIKLKYEPANPARCNYFVHVLDGYNSNTIDTLKNRYKAAFEISNDTRSAINEVVVYLCILKFPKKYKKNKCDFICFDKTNYKSQLNSLLQ